MTIPSAGTFEPGSTFKASPGCTNNASISFSPEYFPSVFEENILSLCVRLTEKRKRKCPKDYVQKATLSNQLRWNAPPIRRLRFTI